MNLKPFLALLICALLIAYASLYPFTGWCLPPEGILAWCAPRLPEHISESDLLVNIIAYIPLGYLAQRLSCIDRSLRYVPWAILAGAGFSFAMESLQTALPFRNASIVDLFTNTLGTVCGAAAALLWQGGTARHGMLTRWREKHLLPGVIAVAGAAVLSLWALSQLSPFVPSADLGAIKNALKPLWHTAHDLSRFDLPQAATYFCYLAGLGVVAQSSFARRPLPGFAAFTSLVLVAKIFTLGRVISLEAVAGLLGALLLLCAGSLLELRLRRSAAILLLLSGFAFYELREVSGGGATVAEFNWIPFRGQLLFELNGIGSILEGIWPFAALSLLYLSAFGRRRRNILVGGIAITAWVVALEAAQQNLPGRCPDITQALLALAGWLAPSFYLLPPDQAAQGDQPDGVDPAQQTRKKPERV